MLTIGETVLGVQGGDGTGTRDLCYLLDFSGNPKLYPKVVDYFFNKKNISGKAGGT